MIIWPAPVADVEPRPRAVAVCRCELCDEAYMILVGVARWTRVLCPECVAYRLN